MTACSSWTSGADPPETVLSIHRGWMRRYSARSSAPISYQLDVASPSTSARVSPASSSAPLMTASSAAREVMSSRPVGDARSTAPTIAVAPPQALIRRSPVSQRSSPLSRHHPTEAPANRKVLNATDEDAGKSLLRTDHLDSVQPAHEFLEHHSDLHLREARSDAVMLANSPPEVRVRSPVDAESEGVLKDRVIAVSRGIEQADGVSCANVGSRDLGVRRCRPHELRHGCRPSNDLIGRGPA